MAETWFLAAIWVGLALIAVLIAIKLRISTALSEIVVGTVAQLIIGASVGSAFLGAQQPWITFLAGAGAIVLTFLAGTELDPQVFRARWKEATVIGLIGFFAPSSAARLSRTSSFIGLPDPLGWSASRFQRHRSRSSMPSCWS